MLVCDRCGLKGTEEAPIRYMRVKLDGQDRVKDRLDSWSSDLCAFCTRALWTRLEDVALQFVREHEVEAIKIFRAMGNPS